MLTLSSVPNITIHCVRHAQGFHNLNETNHAIPDPDLTSLGKQQCLDLKASFPYHDKVTHLVASPLRRTLYTCLIAFSEPYNPTNKVIALPELQETSGLPCDTGSSPVRLAAEFSEGEWEGQVDLSLVKKGWNDKSPNSPWAPEASKIEARALAARKYLRELGSKASKNGEDVQIVVVTHGGYLHYFTEDWVGHDKFVGTGWQNTEWRSYNFRDESGADARASLVETRESRERRAGEEAPLTETEQKELRQVAENQWSNSGFQAAKPVGKL